jgi:hypothetical protein
MPFSSQGEAIGQRLTWSFIFRHEWDRVGFHFCSMAFGVWSIVLTLAVPQSQYSPWLIFIGLVFDVSFLVVGIFLFVSLRNGSYRMRVQGYGIYVGALVLLGILTFALSRSPFGLLAFGFAFQGLNAIRMMREKQRTIMLILQARREDAAKEAESR